MDIQTLLPKSTEVARAKHVEVKRPETYQQQSVAEANRRNVHRQQTVGALVKIRGFRIDRDGGSERRERRPGHGHQGEGTVENDPSSGQVQVDGTQNSRPDGTGRLVNVVLGNGWGRE